MVVIAHFVAVTGYVGATALAAAPLARPIRVPRLAVLGVLAVGVAAHLAAFIGSARELGYLPVMGLGPALSFAGLVLAVSLLIVETAARDVGLTMAAAPLAALVTAAGNALGVSPVAAGSYAGVWLISHIALGFVGMAAFATAAAAGAMYLIERRELKARRLGAMLRAFPPLETLDRVNHIGALTAWLALTLGVVLAASYSIANRAVNVPQTVWGIAAWLAVSALAIGRLRAGWRASRAAVITGVAFVCVMVLYLAVRLNGSAAGVFL